MSAPSRTSPAILRATGRVVVLVALLASGWLLAPAISAQPYLPGAEDFEQPVPELNRLAPAPAPAARPAGHVHSQHLGEGAVTHRSGVIAAPARFDAAGIAGEMRPVELRGRDSGGQWSDWLTIANGDPAWFGGADELQLRSRGWRPRGTLHYVNVSGDATPAEAALTAARTTVNRFAVATIGLFGAGEAAAAPAKPGVVDRGDWGAKGRDGCEPRTGPVYGKVKAAAVHHTVSSNTYSQAEAPSVVLAICRFHRNGNGWNDIGYNALVDRFGTIYAGRAGGLGRGVVGAQAQGFNAQTTGVAVIGNHVSQKVSGPTMRGLTSWLAFKLDRHGRAAIGTTRLTSAGGAATPHPAGSRVRVPLIVPHRRLNSTACPGDAFAGKLDKLRERVQRRIDESG